MDSPSAREWRVPLTQTDQLDNTGQPDNTGQLTHADAPQRLRAALRCLTPRPAALLAFVVVLLAFLLTRAVMQWQIRPERRGGGGDTTHT